MIIIIISEYNDSLYVTVNYCFCFAEITDVCHGYSDTVVTEHALRIYCGNNPTRVVSFLSKLFSTSGLDSYLHTTLLLLLIQATVAILFLIVKLFVFLL